MITAAFPVPTFLCRDDRLLHLPELLFPRVDVEAEWFIVLITMIVVLLPVEHNKGTMDVTLKLHSPVKATNLG